MYLLLYIDRPPTSASSDDRSKHKIALSSAVLQMLMDPNFLILLFLFTLDGYGWGLILVTSILSDIGYGQHEADVVMAIARPFPLPNAFLLLECFGWNSVVSRLWRCIITAALFGAAVRHERSDVSDANRLGLPIPTHHLSCRGLSPKT
mmetsp:Transcript_56844/g.133235  ORF Transcript_56844/g.133235 Transcript_56844/m.133235 type:complete len:149 (-) Transcript_56844:75-521(-)